MPLSYDPGFSKAAAGILSAMAAAPKPALHEIEPRRKANTGYYEISFALLPDTPDVEHTIHPFKSYDGQTISVHRFFLKTPTSTTAGQSAILHTHGGGMFQFDVDLFKRALSYQVQRTGVQVFSVDYRLAPENPHPTPVEDCYAGLTWLYEHAEQFSVDKSRIATMGESAGGNLAAALALMARDRGLSPPLAKQILIYPMLDDRTTVPNPALEPLALWNTEDNVTGWTAYLGKGFGTDNVSPYAAPARVSSVEGLPATYIDVGELDIFRDEDLAYAARVAAANISLEVHVYPGLPHAFEIYASEAEVSKRAFENRFKAILSV
ncbi:alpha/beta hydrolase fold-domain-containing protein [Aspergillus leporis]|jgi:acetyl esterase/lipase|uniref:Alpha/beta hydrolase fold-domain-containing protein n=1 Tax=Aspergillus leporis TaxID=41062 RepID=A0A5N5XBI1_9EURO|nr:alpha/beta hydrolase fold-domain-containing protein [Aspergillus leporis]